MTEILLMISLVCLIAFGVIVALEYNRRMLEWKRAMAEWHASNGHKPQQL